MRLTRSAITGGATIHDITDGELDEDEQASQLGLARLDAERGVAGRSRH